MNRRQMLRLLAVGSLGVAAWGCRPPRGDEVAVAPIPESPGPVARGQGPRADGATTNPDEVWDVVPNHAEAASRHADELASAPDVSESAKSAHPEPRASDHPETDEPVESVPEPNPAPEDEPAGSPTPDRSPAELVLICRDDWGARAAGDRMRPHTIQRMMVHHSAFIAHEGQGPEAMREYQDLHMDDRGWADIAYHVGVDRDGYVYELRRWDRAGDTSTPYDPAGHFLLLLDGNFQQQQPTEVQFDMAARVLAWASVHFGVSLDTITGHRDHVVTACPGDAMYRRLDQLAQRAADHRRVGVELRRTC